MLASFSEIQNLFLSDGLEMDLMAKSGLVVIKVIITVVAKVTTFSKLDTRHYHKQGSTVRGCMDHGSKLDSTGPNLGLWIPDHWFTFLL